MATNKVEYTADDLKKIIQDYFFLRYGRRAQSVSFEVSEVGDCHDRVHGHSLTKAVVVWTEGAKGVDCGEK